MGDAAVYVEGVDGDVVGDVEEEAEQKEVEDAVIVLANLSLVVNDTQLLIQGQW